MFSCGILCKLRKIKLHKNVLRIVGEVAGQTSYVVTHRDRQIYVYTNIRSYLVFTPDTQKRKNSNDIR